MALPLNPTLDQSSRPPVAELPVALKLRPLQENLPVALPAAPESSPPAIPPSTLNGSRSRQNKPPVLAGLLQSHPGLVATGLLAIGAMLGTIITAPAIYLVARSSTPVSSTRMAFYPSPAPATLTVRQLPEVPDNHPIGLAIGQRAPEIDGPDVDGKRFKLSDYRGKVVILDFWGNWCPFCKNMFPWERRMTQKALNQPLAVLGVNNDANAALVKQLIEREKMLTRCWWDGSGFRGPIFSRWEIEAVPTIFILDHKGVIRYKIDGAPQDTQELDDMVDRLLAERAREVK